MVLRARCTLTDGSLCDFSKLSPSLREEAQKKAARERYLEMHRAGKVKALFSRRTLGYLRMSILMISSLSHVLRNSQTDEAKADLARLAKIRKEREEAAERRKAEAASAELARKEALAKSNRKL